MKYDTTFINRNFLLKVYGVDSENRRINRLVGVSGLVGLIGVELTEKFITRAPSRLPAAPIRKPSSSTGIALLPINKQLNTYLTILRNERNDNLQRRI